MRHKDVNVHMARQGGVNSQTRAHFLEHGGDRPLRPSPMDPNAKDSMHNGPLNRRHLTSAWQPGADEGSPSSIESIAIGDQVYPSAEGSLPTFQKLRGGGNHLPDMSLFSEDEDAQELTQDGSPISHSRRRKHAGHPLAHLNVFTNFNDVMADEISTHSEDYSFPRVKLLCSYGGKILPRPTDNQLRYVGGETRLITVSRDISYHELILKMAELYAQAHTIKYKLPEEDLDALVSVSSNEDVANMMEEYDRLQAAEASPRLRLFLFSDVDHDSVHLNESLGDQRNPEQRYVDAVNGISETGSRKHSLDGGSLAVAPVVMDSLIDVGGDAWSLNRPQDSVPVALLAPQISQDVASLIHHVPVALPVSSIPPAPSSSSAPSSPPLLPRVLKQAGFIPDMRLPFHPEQHSNMSGHQYTVVQADGNVLETDNFGVNLSTASTLHDHLYNASDMHRGSESPRIMQHEGDLVGGQQDLAAREDLRRLSEVRIPRVPSHGKLTRLSEQHLEATSSARQRHSYQQSQQTQQQGGWPTHLFEEQTHVYRRVELVQSTSDVLVQPIAPGQQQQLPHFRSPFQNILTASPIDQLIYRPADHLSQVQGEEVFAPFMQRSISANTMGPVGSTAAVSYNVGAGSAPTSPRFHASNMQSQSQLQQVPRTYAGPNYADQQQQHNPRNHPHSDGVSRLRPATSPPRYRDHLGQTDDRLLRPLQQPVTVTPDILQQELFLYDGHNNGHSQYTEGVTRAQVPQYLGHNPFQDGSGGFSESYYSGTLDGGDGRRQRERIPQQSFQPSLFNSRDDFQEHNIPSAEPLSAHPKFLDKPMDWVVHQCGRDAEETRPWRSGRACTGQNENAKEGYGVDSEAPKVFFLHLPEDSEDLLAMSDSYLLRNSDVVESPIPNNQHSRGTGTQSYAVGPQPSTLGQVAVDMPQIPSIVGRKNESAFFAKPQPKLIEVLPDHESKPAGTLVNHLSSDSSSNKLASQMETDDKAAVVAFDNLFHHLSDTSNVRLGNIELTNSAELRWGGINDANESKVESSLQIRDKTNKQDRFQHSSGSEVPQGGQSRPSSGTRIEVSEDITSQRLHNNSIISQGNDALATEDISSTAYSFHNLILPDGMSPPVAQLSVSTAQTQVVQPMTTRVTSFTIPALSITVSTELSIPTLPSASANTGTSVGTSITEQEATSMGSLLFNPGSIAPRISEAAVDGSTGQNVDPGRKGNRFNTSQLSATGHLAEDMASSVLVSSTRDMLAPPSSNNNLQVEDKGKCLPFSQDTTSVIQSNLCHALSFGASNWDAVQNLTDVNAKVDDNPTVILDITGQEEDLDLQPPPIVEEEPTVEEPAAGAGAGNHEDLTKGFSNTGTAEDAEAEAIRSGLQTILNADLEEMRELGSGTFGTVYHGKWRGTDVAIKRIKASCFAGRPAERDRLIADFWREACTLSQLHHPNVVAFYGVVRDGPGGTLATVTEFMVNGSLKQVLQKKDRTIDRRKRLLIAMDAAFGMEYLHNKNIVHFDLKCDNLLVNMRDPHRPICKVGDLGLSKVKHQTMVSGGVRGTLPWMAPELLNGSSTLVTEKVDVFSFGIVMWELLTGEEPYANMHYGAIIGGIVNNTLRPSIPTWCDPLWKSLMERCWSAEPASRPSFSEVASELRLMAAALQPKGHAT
ncbi:RAF-like serine/threonine-protein kinase PRAF isoform X1 [Physcomitrium patens]|uniref:Protein kinase domain-containing protein n=2 Tax=Physcomitrium patens TaxID=3218 RepID=A0A2K1JEF3_PHYPA|nr:uncharacterized protein LOC112292346 isoform X2 [Physcomitrium patens]PNR39915.1 hypothetical protein PHYPA_020195 [Physcomitrium patens]|eukprot:XP_024396473.1 uncharacterized protein LOC112292346 isoform X2 [Physcomitrella patens]